MNWVYDIILVVLFAYMIIRGWRQGILASVLRLIGWGLAIYIIVAFTAQWAQTFYTNYIEARAVSTVQAAIPEDTVAAMNSGADALTQVQSVIDSLSGMLGGLADNLNISGDTAAQLQGVMGLDSYSLALLIVQTLLQPLLIAVVRGVMALLILLVCVLIFSLLAGLSAKMTRKGKSMLSRSNQVFGAIAAVIQCVGVGFVAAYILELGAQLLNTTWLNEQILQSTLILKVFIR